MINTRGVEKVFVLTKDLSSTNELHKEKLNQFVWLLKSCDLHVTMATSLPGQEDVEQYQFYFFDLFDHEYQFELLTQAKKFSYLHQTNVALFNVSEHEFCEKTCLLSNIKGVFYAQDQADIIIKGIARLKNSERWYKRETMDRALEYLLARYQQEHVEQQQGVDIENEKLLLANLTKRERMIIHLVSSGAQNKEIADKLHISPNTVKTHIYSIFRKTKSRNRIELISWSQQIKRAAALA